MPNPRRATELPNGDFVCTTCKNAFTPSDASRKRRRFQCTPCASDYSRERAAREKAGAPTTGIGKVGFWWTGTGVTSRGDRSLTDKMRAAKRKYESENRKHNPGYKFRYLARARLNRAVKDGRLIREPCRECGDPMSEGHHEDYSRPLSVIWLCRKHHRELHKRLSNSQKG